MTERAPFDSSLPEARRAAAGWPLGSDGQSPERETSIEQHLIAALEESFLEFLIEATPGVELEQMLLAFPPRQLSASAQLEWLRAHARCSAWWAAQECAALVAFAGSEPQRQEFEVRGQPVIVEDVAREEVAVALRWTSSFAQARIDEARLLVGALPETRRALEAGEISPAHVRVIADSASKLTLTAEAGSPEFARACEQLERRVLPVAASHGLSRTRSAANRAVTQIDPDGRIARRTAAYRGRGVWLRDDSDGVSTLIGRLASEHAHAAMTAIEALALAEDFGDASLGLGERRSLAMLHLVLNGTSSINGGNVTAEPGQKLRTPIRAHVDVIVDLPTLLGLQDNDGEIVGGGSITAESIRQLVLSDTSSTMRRLITDPTTGHLLDVGRRRYAIPASLREFIAIRDQRCRFPGCDARAASAEVDHALPWDDGGRSDRSNLGALCKRHHQVKTHGGWSIASSAASGACDWRAPSGLTYSHSAVAINGSAESGVPLPDRDVGQTRDLIDDDS